MVMISLCLLLMGGVCCRDDESIIIIMDISMAHDP